MDMQSKAKKLIEMIQTAPVEWKPLGEVVNIKNGKDWKKLSSGDIPVYGSGGVMGYVDTFAYDKPSVLIPRKGSITNIFYVDFPFWNVDTIYYTEIDTSKLKPKFFYYFMRTIDLMALDTGSGRPSLTQKILNKIKIPIPPLETQQKIVKILDKFTELEATLEAELALRKRQYRYYRDFLLDFDNQIWGGIADDYKGRLKDVVWKTLGEVAEYSKNRICSDKLNEHNYVGVDNLLQNREGKKLSGYVPSEGKMTEYIVNDILIGNIRPYLKKIWQADCTGGTNGDVLVIRVTDEKVNPKYLYQVLADDKFFAFNMKHAKGAKMPRGSKTAIMQYKIPIPPLPEQEKIVAILDKFDTLTHSISEGLPHEIALRRKQYEYYREQLLAFPKAA